jgi:ribosome recycling factor
MSFDFSDFEAKAQKSIEHVRQDIGTLRTGRASVQLLDPVTVEAYGSRMRVSEVASVSAPDPSMIIISPWDKSILTAIAKGVQDADLNLNPIIDGEIIRIVIAPLTEETRKEMVKKLHQKIEAGRVMLRTIRTDAKQEIEAQEGTAGVSEDDIAFEIEQLEEQYKKYMHQLDEMATHKEKDLLTV